MHEHVHLGKCEVQALLLSTCIQLKMIALKMIAAHNVWLQHGQNKYLWAVMVICTVEVVAFLCFPGQTAVFLFSSLRKQLYKLSHCTCVTIIITKLVWHDFWNNRTYMYVRSTKYYVSIIWFSWNTCT